MIVDLIANLVQALGKAIARPEGQPHNAITGSHIGVSFAGRDLREYVLSGEFTDCEFQDTDMRGAVLIGTFVGVSFLGADLRDTNIERAKFVDCEF